MLFTRDLDASLWPNGRPPFDEAHDLRALEMKIDERAAASIKQRTIVISDDEEEKKE